jgi:hypothetical protein
LNLSLIEPPRYNWDIVESGVKHHSPLSLIEWIVFCVTKIRYIMYNVQDYSVKCKLLIFNQGNTSGKMSN